MLNTDGLKLMICGFGLCVLSKLLEMTYPRGSPLAYYLLFVGGIFCLFRGLNMILIERYGPDAQPYSNTEVVNPGDSESVRIEILPTYTQSPDPDTEITLAEPELPPPTYDEALRIPPAASPPS